METIIISNCDQTTIKILTNLFVSSTIIDKVGIQGMKIIKVNVSQLNAHSSIMTSMNNSKEIAICNNLDACGCTGNGNC
ncbi:MAG: hypothetical protein ACI4OG_01220 [Bacilli bacterium]